MVFVELITPRTEPETYQSVSNEANTIRPAEFVEKIFPAATSMACAVAAWTCDWMIGKIVCSQTRCSPTAPSSASPSRVSGTSAFSTCLLYTSDAADERSSVDLG